MRMRDDRPRVNVLIIAPFLFCYEMRSRKATYACNLALRPSPSDRMIMLNRIIATLIQ